MSTEPAVLSPPSAPENVDCFDVRLGEGSPSLDFHFCREWDGDVGCHGTNPLHGLSFDEAKAEMVAYHEKEAQKWRDMTLDELKRNWNGSCPDEPEFSHPNFS